MTPDWLVPDWPAPASVRVIVTTRHGGVSSGPYATLNLGAHVGDSPAAVAANRAILQRCLPGEPVWLEQVHGIDVVDAGVAPAGSRADASIARGAGVVCAVQTADCLPVLFCDDGGQVVGAAHAGWRGLLAGILEATLARMEVDSRHVMAWMGPAIGPAAFEVGQEVRDAFVAADPRDASSFVPGARPGKWQADLFQLARQRLARCGVERVFGGGVCTFSDPERYFSYRRDGVTGRFATLVWRSA